MAHYLCRQYEFLSDDLSVFRLVRDRCINNPVRDSNKTHFSAHTVIYAVMWTLIKMAVNILVGTNSRHSTVSNWRNKYQHTNMKMVKVKCTLVQALRLSTGRTAHRGSRGVALPFLDHGTRRGWGVSVTPRPLFTPGKHPVPIVQEAGWAPGPVWTGAENLASTEVRSPDRPARSQWLHRLHYPGHTNMKGNVKIRWYALISRFHI